MLLCRLECWRLWCLRMCWGCIRDLYREGSRAEELVAFQVELYRRKLMRKFLLLSILVFVASVFVASEAAVAQSLPPVSTFSIVAIDPQTGEMGVAVASRFFSRGGVR